MESESCESLSLKRKPAPVEIEENDLKKPKLSFEDEYVNVKTDAEDSSTVKTGENCENGKENDSLPKEEEKKSAVNEENLEKVEKMEKVEKVEKVEKLEKVEKSEKDSDENKKIQEKPDEKLIVVLDSEEIQEKVSSEQEVPKKPVEIIEIPTTPENPSNTETHEELSKSE